MSKLDDFLGLTDVSDIRKTIEVELDGKKFEITVRPITEDEHTEFQRRSNNISKNKVTFDSGKYNNLVLSSCIVEPNFSDENFLRQVKCTSATEFLNRKFPAGTLNEIARQIQMLSGFESYDLEIENAKN